MGAVAVVVTRRKELPRHVGLDSGVAPSSGIEMPRADQFPIAAGGEFFAEITFSVPARNVLVDRLSTYEAVAGAVGKARAFRPDAAINHTDDDVFTSAADTAKLLPNTTRSVQPKESRSGRCNCEVQLIFGN